MTKITNKLARLIVENPEAIIIPVARQSFEVETEAGATGRITEVSVDEYIMYNNKAYLKSCISELYDDYYYMNETRFATEESYEDIKRTIRFLFASQWKVAIACHMEPYDDF